MKAPLSSPQSRPTFRKRAFSLVEVVIALGVVSFAFIGIIGSLPVGIQSMQDAMQLQAKANIAQQLRSDLQQIPFGAGSDYSIDSLTGTTWWFTAEGTRTTKRAEAFYEASFQLDAASVVSAESEARLQFTSASARNVRVTLEFPLDAPQANRKRATITLLSARQKNA